MAQRQSHSFTRSLLSASVVAFFSTSVAASGVSTSVFPNSACSGASTSTGGLVGIGKVTLSTGEVETHCGCPSDNLPAFDACPTSSAGESVCNSVLNLDTGAFTASCSIVACQGSECPTTVVNTVIVDDEDCFTSGKGALGYVTIDGESKCACSAESAEFVSCKAPENGRAACVAVDADFLGLSYSREESVTCGAVCDEGFTLVGGECSSLTKRAPFAPFPYSGPSQIHKPSGASKSHGASPTHGGHGPSHTPGGHGSHHGSHGHGVSKSHGPSSKHHGASPTPSVHHHSRRYTGPSKAHGPSASIPGETPLPYSSRAGVSQHHHHHHHTSFVAPSEATKVGPSKSSGPSSSPGASQVARMPRSIEEFVFSNDVCASDERSCATGGMGDFSCVRLDDVTECGGCHSTGDAVDCLAGAGIQSAVCLQGGCVVRACVPGFVQTSEGTCTPKA
ncbi:hypothetical protein P7C70_g1308, partial [Phenoliferia sp. Uapishka_3]